MANVLSIDKQVLAIGALVEGASIRSVERQLGIHRDTVMRLGLRVGQACAKLMHEQMRDLSCSRIQIDEIWGFVAKKQRSVKPTEDGEEVGDMWTFVALDPDSKLVPCYAVGKRDGNYTQGFINDL